MTVETFSLIFSLLVIGFFVWMLVLIGWGPIKSWLFKPEFNITRVEVIQPDESDRFGSAYMVFEAENTTRWGAESVRFEFKLYNEDGVVIGEKSVYLSNVYGGEKIKMKERYIEEGTVEARLMRTIVRNY